MVSTVDDVLKSSVRVDSIVSMSSEDASVNVTRSIIRALGHTYLKLV